MDNENAPVGKLTPLLKISVDEAGRTIIQARKGLRVDSILLGRVMEVWVALYIESQKMPDVPPPDEEKIMSPLTCPDCGQQTLNAQTGACPCGFVLSELPDTTWKPRMIHCRDCGHDVRIETRPDNDVVRCGCGRDIYIGPERRKLNQ